MAYAIQTEDVSLDRDQVILRMVQFARAGRIAEAQGVLRTYLQENPADGTMHYNLTCLDLLLQQKELAMEDLQRALENGYTNFRLIEVDKDLDLLRDDPRFAQMVGRFQEKFLQDFQSRALYLDEGYAGQKLSLQPQDSAIKASSPQVTVAFNAHELLITLSVEDPSYAGEKPPWQDGCGVLINLIHPVSPDDYESRRYYSYGFFARDGDPEATLVGKHGQVLLQPVPQLKPVITRKAHQTTYKISIPWEFFTPYAPSLDPEMGLNILYFGGGQGSTQPVFSLIPEKKMTFQPNTWRRYIPVFFLDSDRSTPMMRGRLYDQLCEGETLGLQLALWSGAEGQAECRLTIHPLGDPATMEGTPVLEKASCEFELNFFNYSLDLADLPTGSYLLRAEMTGPDGQVFTRDFPFDNFQRDWLGSLNVRVHKLRNAEQSTLKYYLFTLTRQAENRHPQSSASHLHEAYDRVVRLIELSEAGLSCLPDQGFFRGGFASGVMTMRFCAMHLPVGYKKKENLQILMVLPPEPGIEDQLAQSLGSALEGKTDAIVLVPQSHGYSSLATETAAKETLLAMQWAKELFGQETITLVGLGNGTDAALEASLLNPDLCREILLDGDQLYRDMEEFSAAGVDEALGNRLNHRPYTIVSTLSSSDRLPVIESTMKELGYQIKMVFQDRKALDSAWLSSWFLAIH